jgi:Haem-binding domain
MKIPVKKLLRWTGFVLAGAFVIIQFIRPTWNQRTSHETPLEARFPVPTDVQTILKRSCYDCHSNQTVYPWYAQVQPIGWWLQSHIDHAKRSMNFDEFTSQRSFRQFHRLGDIKEQLDDDEMPLPSYLFIHRYARLSPEEKTLLVGWSQAMRDSMKTWYPADSLSRPRFPGQRRERPQ